MTNENVNSLPLATFGFWSPAIGGSVGGLDVITELVLEIQPDPEVIVEVVQEPEFIIIMENDPEIIVEVEEE